MAKNDDERAKRLAAALRENLKRRKAQARGEEAPATSSGRKSGPMNTEGENEPNTVFMDPRSSPG